MARCCGALHSTGSIGRTRPVALRVPQCYELALPNLRHDARDTRLCPRGCPGWGSLQPVRGYGNGDLRAMREGRMDPSGEGLTQAGRIVGMIHIIISIIAIPVLIILFMIGAFAAAATSGAAGGAGP